MCTQAPTVGADDVFRNAQVIVFEVYSGPIVGSGPPGPSLLAIALDGFEKTATAATRSATWAQLRGDPTDYHGTLRVSAKHDLGVRTVRNRVLDVGCRIVGASCRTVGVVSGGGVIDRIHANGGPCRVRAKCVNEFLPHPANTGRLGGAPGESTSHPGMELL